MEGYAWADEQKPDTRRRDQGERARNREALVANGKRRKSGGRVWKECALTRGDLALRLKERRTVSERSEESAEAVVVAGVAAKGQTEERARRPETSKGHGPR